MEERARLSLLEKVAGELETRPAVVLASAIPDSVDRPTAETLRSTFSEGDLVRLSELHTDRGATAFLISRAVLRAVLEQLLQRPGKGVEFVVSDRGKPSLAEEIAPPLYFNTSHSRTHALVALSRLGDLGVDVEDVGPVDDRVVQRSLSSDELQKLELLDPADRERAFFRLWTIKEACAKATGVGIGIGMRKVPATLDDSGRWTEFMWQVLDLGPQAAAAVAVRTDTAAGAARPVAVHRDVLSGLFGIEPGFGAPGGG